MSGPTPVATSGEDKCLAYFGSGASAAICRRPEGHKPIEEDGIGHSATPYPARASLSEVRAQVHELLREAWQAGRDSKPEDENPYK